MMAAMRTIGATSLEEAEEAGEEEETEEVVGGSWGEACVRVFEVGTGGAGAGGAEEEEGGGEGGIGML